MTDDADEGATTADEPRPLNAGRAGRRAPTCPSCGVEMRFEEGKQIHDLWSERFVCEKCGRESFRSYGRGSV